MDQVSGEDMRRKMIAEAAYFRAQRRGFSGGDPVDDWLEAEHEVDRRLGNGRSSMQVLEERLAAANERLQAFRRKLAELTDEAREELEEDIDKLARHRDRLRQRIREAQQRSGEAADKAKLQAEKVWDEITALVERLGRRRGRRP